MKWFLVGVFWVAVLAAYGTAFVQVANTFGLNFVAIVGVVILGAYVYLIPAAIFIYGLRTDTKPFWQTILLWGACAGYAYLFTQGSISLLTALVLGAR